MANDLSRDDVERYLRVNRRGKGMFVGIAGAFLAVGFVVGLAMEGPREHQRHGRRRTDHSGAWVLAIMAGAVGLGVAVGVDNVRRRAQLGGLTGDQIRRLDEALIANADVESEVGPALIERTWQRANNT